MGQVKKGEGLVVLRKEDGWVLVVHQPLGGGGDKGPLKVGWIPESDVLIP